MSGIAKHAGANLPANAEELAKYILVGREKLQSVRAEIRAIDKLHLAEEVREQKRDEARMLSEALLDAEVRIGQLFKLFPKAQGMRTDRQPLPSGGKKLETKEQAAERLGFGTSQVNRFEALAAHPEEVEQVKAEARENDDLPTRTAVLNLIKYKNEKREAQRSQIDEDARLAMALSKAVTAVELLPCDIESIQAMRRGMPFAIGETVRTISKAMSILSTIAGHLEGR